MNIASEKRKSNIAEYILYMWQVEDSIRAYNLDIAEIEDVVKVLISNKKIFDKESKKTLINKLEVTIEKMNEDDKNKVKKQLENF